MADHEEAEKKDPRGGRSLKAGQHGIAGASVSAAYWTFGSFLGQLFKFCSSYSILLSQIFLLKLPKSVPCAFLCTAQWVSEHQGSYLSMQIMANKTCANWRKECSMRSLGQIRLFLLSEYFTCWKILFERGQRMDRWNLINSFDSEILEGWMTGQSVSFYIFSILSLFCFKMEFLL